MFQLRCCCPMPGISWMQKNISVYFLANAITKAWFCDCLQNQMLIQSDFATRPWVESE